MVMCWFFNQPLFDCDAPGGFLIACLRRFHGGNDDILFFDQGIIDLLSFWGAVIALFVFLALLKSPKFKGRSGELQVNLTARIFLDKGTYHLIKNVTLPTAKSVDTASPLIAFAFSELVRFLATDDPDSL